MLMMELKAFGKQYKLLEKRRKFKKNLINNKRRLAFVQKAWLKADDEAQNPGFAKTSRVR
jgi:hypothetical protein